MKKADIKIGGVYRAKVSDKLTDVRIDAVNANSGWDATNLATNKKVRIKTAQRLRTPSPKQTAKTTPAKQTPAKKKPTPKKPKANTTKKDDAPKTKRAPGILEVAAQILAKAKEPMGCKAIVEQAMAKNLWTTSGKTPSATLYAAIIREISTKGKDARFEKVDRGLFTLKGGKR